MGDSQISIVNAVVHHQQPASETLLYAVQAIAGGRLGGLHALKHGVTTGDVL